MQASRVGIAPGEYYHIYNRGAFRRDIFRDKADWQRFLFGIIFFQSPLAFTNIGRMSHTFSPQEGFAIKLQEIERVVQTRFVELAAFCLMSNHVHLLVKEIEEGGIAKYMQRVQIGYTKYFNEKYDASGHVFQGPYRSVHVKDNEQLTYLSAYIHCNPRELKGWRGKEFEYPWSSLQDYTNANRWGGLLASEFIAGQFGGTKNSNYADFVRTSPAKVIEEKIAGINVL